MHSEPGLQSSPRRPLDPIPATINGYRVEGVLGRGGTGIVLRVHDDALDRPMALKLLADELDDDARARFMIEARAAGRIIHPNVVQVFSVGSFEGRTFITQELVEGHALSSLLEVRGRLSPASVIDIGVQAARGLQRAAEVGVVHRDVKPHNLLVTEDGLVKLADFGLAKLLHAPSPLTDTGTTVGTPHYMSPEQGLAQELDARSDQYSLGATLYHLVSGKLPFDSDNAVALLLKHVQDPLEPVRSVAPDCPFGLAAAIERMLAKKKEDRFASFDDLIEALEGALDEIGTGEDGEGPTLQDAIAEAALAPDPHEEIETVEETAPPQLTAALAKVAVYQPSVATTPAPEVAPPASRVREAALFLSLVVIALAVVIVAGFSEQTRRTHSVAAPVLPVVEKIVEEAQTSEAEPVVPVRSPFEKPALVTETVAEKPAPVEKPAVEKPASKYERLISMLDDAKTAERAARELGELGDQRATPALIRVLENSTSMRARAAAAEALGRLGDTRAIDPLQAAADHAKADAVRQAAREAQQRLFHVTEEDDIER